MVSSSQKNSRVNEHVALCTPRKHKCYQIIARLCTVSMLLLTSTQAEDRASPPAAAAARRGTCLRPLPMHRCLDDGTSLRSQAGALLHWKPAVKSRGKANEATDWTYPQISFPQSKHISSAKYSVSLRLFSFTRLLIMLFVQPHLINPSSLFQVYAWLAGPSLRAFADLLCLPCGPASWVEG